MTDGPRRALSRELCHISRWCGESREWGGEGAGGSVGDRHGSRGEVCAALSIILKPSRPGSDHVRRGKTSGCISAHKRRAPLRFPSVSCSHPVNFPRAFFLLSPRFSSASQPFLQVLPFQHLNRNPLQPLSPRWVLLPSLFLAVSSLSPSTMVMSHGEDSWQDAGLLPWQQEPSLSLRSP